MDRRRDVQAEIAETWEAELEVAGQFDNLALELLRTFDSDGPLVKIESEYQLAVSYLILKAFGTFRAGLELCRTGFAEDAEILGRVLFEIAVNLEFIATDPDEWAWVFCRFESLRMLRELKDVLPEIEAKGGRPAEDLSRAEDLVDELRRRHPNCDGWKTWSGRSVVEMAKTAGLLPAYTPVYQRLNDLTHSSPYAAQRYMSIASEEMSLRLPPEPVDIDKPLVLLCDMFYRCLHRADGVFGLGGKDRLVELASRVATVFGAHSGSLPSTT